MKAAISAAVLLAATGCASVPPDNLKSIQYPETAAVDHVDRYHGVEVADPYRWLEDLDSKETKAWVDAQNKVTFGYLESIPARRRIQQRLTELWNFEKFEVPQKVGDRYFFAKNDGLQNQSVIYVMEGLDGRPRLLLDPNQLSSDGTVALTEAKYSPDGKLMAYGTSSGGSDWQEWRVRKVDTGEDLSDAIQWVKFSDASWSRDSQGFYYSRYDEPEEGDALEGLNYHQKVYYHRIGTPQSEDKLVYQRPDQKEWGFDAIATEDGRYLVLEVAKGTDRRKRIFYQDLQSGSTVVELLNDFDASYEFLGNQGPVFWFKTDLEAPRGRVVAIDIRKPQRSQWKELIPETEDTLRDVQAVKGAFIAAYLKDAHSLIRVHDLEGRELNTVDLPGLGTARDFTGSQNDATAFYSYETFSSPDTIYRYDAQTRENSVFRRSETAFNPEDFETRQVFYESKDGTRVPMFVSSKKGLKLDGQNPTILYGYGGFNIPVTPRFGVMNVAWMEMGGIFAAANLRGGGEYGKQWHEAGTKLKKQNVFDDFIAAAEFLIDQKYTDTSRLAIRGGSNGGLLVGAVMTQRPELIAAALPAVGVMDMLRFDKFTIGWAWVSDYGSPEDPEEFKALRAYSPYHNLKPAEYPPTLITTADHDDRVVPAHSFKFAAALQKAQQGEAPTLIRIETRAGHGRGKPTAKRIEEAADTLAFLVKVMGLE